MYIYSKTLNSFLTQCSLNIFADVDELPCHEKHMIKEILGIILEIYCTSPSHTMGETNLHRNGRKKLKSATFPY